MKKFLAVTAICALSTMLNLSPAKAENWEYGHLRCETSYLGGTELLHDLYQRAAEQGLYDRCTWKNQWGSVIGDGKMFVRAYNLLAETRPSKGYTKKQVETHLPTGETFERPYGQIALYSEILGRESSEWKQPITAPVEPDLPNDVQQLLQDGVHVAQVVSYADDAMTHLSAKKKPIPEPGLQGILDILGSKGWEVVSITPTQTPSLFSREVLLKRFKK